MNRQVMVHQDIENNGDGTTDIYYNLVVVYKDRRMYIPLDHDINADTAHDLAITLEDVINDY